MNAEIMMLPLGPLQTNCYILRCKETGETAVIDPSYSADTIIEAIGDHPLTHIILTHAHFDHVGALADLHAAYPDIPIYGHKDGQVMLLNGAKSALRYGIELAQPPEATHLIDEGDTLTVGTLTLDTLFTPGHCPGSLTFVLRDHPIAFVGDVLFNSSIGRTDLPGGNFTLLVDMIEQKLWPLPDETQVLSGHGSVTTIGHEIATNPFLN